MITLEKVKQDIASGLSTKIYYSVNSKWWTHLDSDVLEATGQGISFREAQFSTIMGDSDPQVISSFRDKFKMDEEKQMDPVGSIIKTENNPVGFIHAAELNSGVYGANGIEAFMRSHHQNSIGEVMTTWDDYNNLINAEKGVEMVARWK